MGTQTLGNTTSPGTSHFFFVSGGSGFSLKADQANFLTASGDIYVDKIYFWCGTHDGGSAPFSFALYRRDNTFIAETNVNFSYGTGYGWNRGEFSQANYLKLTNGTQFVGAVYTKGQGLQTAGRGDGGAFAQHTGDGFPSPWSTTLNKTDQGSAGFYITYFPAATVTAIPSTPQFPGATITVNGLSFTAGVKSVKINGVACTSVTVTNDTTLTCVLPSNAQTGQIVVDTYAGTATSAGTLIVSGGRVNIAGVLKSTSGVRVQIAGVLKPVSRIRRAKSDGAGGLILEDVH